MNNPKVNILVLDWNGGNLLYDCIESILKSNYDNFRITIIDNGSNDTSISRIKKSFKNIDYILIDSNLGYSSGYNYAFNKLNKEDDSDYFFLLNNDTLLKKNTIKNLIKGTCVFGPDNIFGPKILNESTGNIWYGGGKLSRLTMLASHIGINKKESSTKLKSMKTDFVSGCAMLLPKKIIDLLGGFNQSYEFYYEDVDLCLRAKHKGYSSFFINDSIVFHKISSSMGGRYSFLKIKHKLKSTLKYLYSNNSILLFCIYMVFNLILFPYVILSKILRIIIK